MGHMLRVILSLLAALILGLSAALSVSAAPSAQTASGAVTLTTGSSPYGTVLFTGSGQALYALSFDRPGTSTTPAVSNCTGRCATIWVPLLVPGPSPVLVTSGGVQATGISAIPRTTDSGQTAYQATYFGHPLYTFVADTAAGQTNGENVGAFSGIWQLLFANGQVDPGVATVNVETTSNGTVLSAPTAFKTSRSLYMLTADPPNTTTCLGPCAQIWPALLTTGAPVAGPGVTASLLGTITRPDGTMQVTYAGHPVYFFSGDLAPGAPSGLTGGEQYVDPLARGVWYTVTPAGNPQPTAITMTASPAGSGSVLALQPPATSVPGLYTVYTFSTDTATTSTCTGLCARIWPPLLTNGTPSAASGSGVDSSKFGTITRADGTTQVTYNGRPLYLFVRDLAGSTLGNNVNAFGGTFKAVPVSGTPTTPVAGPPFVTRQVSPANGGLTASFTVTFNSTRPGQAYVLFGSGPGCLGLLGTASQDVGAGSTFHSITVTGNDLGGTAGPMPVTPGNTYWFEVETVSSSGTTIDDNAGMCYSVTIPSAATPPGP